MNIISKEKIGQLFLVGVTKRENLNDVINLIKKYHIGGVIIYKNNYSNYEEMINVINQLKLANKENKLPLFISIDQECGRVNRFPKEFKNIATASKVNKLSKEEQRNVGEITAEMLSETGLNMNFAPVLDLKKYEDNHYIGDRAYSEIPEEVYEVTKIISEEFEKKGVIPVLKHFPGHGSIKKDSHMFLPRINNYEKILSEDAIPFIKAIENGADAIMVGHIMIKGQTGSLPASISKKYIADIRKRYSYDGLIVSDELAMRSVRYLYGRKKSIYKAANAGLDVIMYKYFVGLENVLEDVINKYNLNKIDTDQIDASYKRVSSIKGKYKINDRKIENTMDIEKINKRIEEVNSKCKKNI